MAKPLSPSSEPCDKDKNKVARQMRVRAQDGPWRGYWFRFFLDEEATLFDWGKATYLLERNDDPRRWGLREHFGINI